MTDFFSNMDMLLRTFWFIAIPTSLIFIIQTIMTFVGLDASEGVEADFDSNLDGGDTPFQLFSLRNLINFLLGFSWAGVSLYKSITNHNLLIFIAFIVGFVFLMLFFLIIRQVTKLAEDNSFKFEYTIGKTAQVYLPIPENKMGKGKVLISIQGSTHELEAISENQRIESNQLVKVIKLESGNILVVQPL
jgi:membrane protein implicated in regulation of membrane protease activity